jgi:hypothetical protein
VPDRAVLAQKSTFECRRLSVRLTGVTREEQEMSWLTEHQRLVGRCAWVAAWVGLVVGQLHALSRFATTEGVEDLALPATAAWAVPAAEALSVPGLLLTMVGSTILGITLLVRGSAPRLPALLLALAIPLAWLILQATSLGNAVLPVMFAFGILGRRLASGSAVADRPAAEAPAR